MIDLGDLTRAMASGLIFTLLVAGILAAFGSVGGCAWYRDTPAGKGYDTSGIFQRLERQAP